MTELKLMPALIAPKPGPTFLVPVATGILPAQEVTLEIDLTQGSSC